MSTLSNQQINQSYQGLIKLADSSSGITSSLQSLQDGLGNDTGIRLAQDFLDAPSVLSFKPIGRASGGVGIATGAGSSNTNLNKICGVFFLDPAIDTYTGITFAVGTVTTTSDEINVAIYSVEQTGTYGIAPANLIMSGITLDATDLSSTGYVTKTLPSPLTLPYPGVFFLAYYITNPGVVTPTARLRGVADATEQSSMLTQLYGYVIDQGSTSYQCAFYGPSNEQSHVVYGGTDAPFLTSYDPTTIAPTASSSSITFAGFVLTK